MYFIQNKQTSKIEDKGFSKLKEAREYAKNMINELKSYYINNSFEIYSDKDLLKVIEIIK